VFFPSIRTSSASRIISVAFQPDAIATCIRLDIKVCRPCFRTAGCLSPLYLLFHRVFLFSFRIWRSGEPIRLATSACFLVDDVKINDYGLYCLLSFDLESPNHCQPSSALFHMIHSIVTPRSIQILRSIILLLRPSLWALLWCRSSANHGDMSPRSFPYSNQ